MSATDRATNPRLTKVTTQFDDDASALKGIGLSGTEPGQTFVVDGVKSNGVTQDLPIIIGAFEGGLFKIDLRMSTFTLFLDNEDASQAVSYTIADMAGADVTVGEPVNVLFTDQSDRVYQDQTLPVLEFVASTGPQYPALSLPNNDLAARFNAGEARAAELGRSGQASRPPASATPLERVTVDSSVPVAHTPQEFEVEGPGGVHYAGLRHEDPTHEITIDQLKAQGYKLAIVEFRGGARMSILFDYENEQPGLVIKRRGRNDKVIEVNLLLDRNANSAAIVPDAFNGHGKSFTATAVADLDGNPIEPETVSTPAVTRVTAIGDSVQPRSTGNPISSELADFVDNKLGPSHEAEPEQASGLQRRYGLGA